MEEQALPALLNIHHQQNRAQTGLSNYANNIINIINIINIKKQNQVLIE